MVQRCSDNSLGTSVHYTSVLYRLGVLFCIPLLPLLGASVVQSMLELYCPLCAILLITLLLFFVLLVAFSVGNLVDHSIVSYISRVLKKHDYKLMFSLCFHSSIS